MFSLSLFSPFSCLYALHTHRSSTHTYIYTYIFTEISPHAFFFFSSKTDRLTCFSLFAVECQLSLFQGCFNTAALFFFFFVCVYVIIPPFCVACFFVRLYHLLLFSSVKKVLTQKNQRKISSRFPSLFLSFFFFYRQASFGVNIINPDELLEKREKRCGSWSKES